VRPRQLDARQQRAPVPHKDIRAGQAVRARRDVFALRMRRHTGVRVYARQSRPPIQTVNQRLRLSLPPSPSPLLNIRSILLRPPLTFTLAKAQTRGRRPGAQRSAAHAMPPPGRLRHWQGRRRRVGGMACRRPQRFRPRRRWAAPVRPRGVGPCRGCQACAGDNHPPQSSRMWTLNGMCGWALKT